MQSNYHPQIHQFLTFMQNREETLNEKKILDCGAGGKNPPLSLFAAEGMAAFGIDISPERLELAKKAAHEQGLSLDLRLGDMSAIPFADETFDVVYEFYSMSHLRKRKILYAIEEMNRVVKPGGLIFLGFMLANTWPLTGRPNEYNEWLQQEDGQETLHSVFFDEEAYEFVEGLEILYTEQEQRQPTKADLEAQTLEAWMAEHKEDWFYDQDEWEAMYAERLEESNYSHRFFILRKP